MRVKVYVTCLDLIHKDSGDCDVQEDAGEQEMKPEADRKAPCGWRWEAGYKSSYGPRARIHGA